MKRKTRSRKAEIAMGLTAIIYIVMGIIGVIGAGAAAKPIYAAFTDLTTSPSDDNIAILAWPESGNDHLFLFNDKLVRFDQKTEFMYNSMDIVAGDFDTIGHGEELAIINSEKGSADLVYIADRNGKYIHQFNANGQELTYIGAGDLIPGDDSPGDEIVVVGSWDTCSVRVFNNKGVSAPNMLTVSKCSDVTVGKFIKGSDREQIAVLRVSGNPFKIMFYEINAETGRLTALPELATTLWRPTANTHYDMITKTYADIPFTGMDSGNLDITTDEDEIVLIHRRWGYNSVSQDRLQLYSVESDEGAITGITKYKTIGPIGKTETVEWKGESNPVTLTQGITEVVVGKIRNDKREDIVIMKSTHWKKSDGWHNIPARDALVLFNGGTGEKLFEKRGDPYMNRLAIYEYIR
ncbi:MAG: hypothetical protein QF475_03000 [Candidatus Undinarchaeales archaeon]|nr:hypothetical protein [Candidatus Undinarchaeales archaeon]